MAKKDEKKGKGTKQEQAQRMIDALVAEAKALIPSVREAIKEEYGIPMPVSDDEIDKVLTIALSKASEVTVQAAKEGKDVSLEEFQQVWIDTDEAVAFKKKLQAAKDEAANTDAKPERPIVSLIPDGVNKKKRRERFRAQIEGPLDYDLFVVIHAVDAKGREDYLPRRINAGSRESHPVWGAQGEGIDFRLVKINEVELTPDARKRLKAPKKPPMYNINDAAAHAHVA